MTLSSTLIYPFHTNLFFYPKISLMIVTDIARQLRL